MTGELPRDAQTAVSVVIAAFADDRWADTLRAIESVRQQTSNVFELILVIDHNPALFARAVAALPDVTVIENEQARGASGARNSGVLASSGGLVAFLDDDAVADPDWLVSMTKHFERPEVIGAGGRIKPIWEGRRPRWFPEELLWAVGATYRGMPLIASPVRNVWAGNMVVRRAAFDSVSGFRPDFGKRGDSEDFQAEDTDFCLRSTRAWGAGVWMYEPLAIAGHSVPLRRSSWRFLVSRCYHEGRNKMVLSKLVDSERMYRERGHVTRTLPRGVLYGLIDAARGDAGGLGRSLTIVCGMAAAAFGVVTAQAAHYRQRGTRGGRGETI